MYIYFKIFSVDEENFFETAEAIDLKTSHDFLRYSQVMVEGIIFMVIISIF